MVFYHQLCRDRHLYVYYPFTSYKITETAEDPRAVYHNNLCVDFSNLHPSSYGIYPHISLNDDSCLLNDEVVFTFEADISPVEIQYCVPYSDTYMLYNIVRWSALRISKLGEVFVLWNRENNTFCGSYTKDIGEITVVPSPQIASLILRRAFDEFE